MIKKISIFFVCTMVFFQICFGTVYATNDTSVTSGVSHDKDNFSLSNHNEDFEYLDYVNNIVEKNYPVTIKQYDVDVNVNENNVLDIKETITINCNISREVFFRSIPLINYTRRADGTSSTSLAQVSNVKTLGPCSTSVKDGFYYLEMPITKPSLGEHKYVISYSYNIGKPISSEYDELYFNIIGTNWSLPIENVSFCIKMPHEFDHSKVGFTSGLPGVENSKPISYTCNGNIISGHSDEALEPGEALTIRCQLPKGYFVNTGLNRDFFDIAIFVLPIIFVAISFLIFRAFTGPQIVDAIEFYPPDGLNSLDIALLYKGVVFSNHVTSLLVYLANKGYLRITEHNNSKFFSKKTTITLTKLKEYDGTDKNEKMFLEGLFKGNKTEIELSSLYDNFYHTVDKIRANVNSFSNKFKIFDKLKVLASLCIPLMAFLSYCLVSARLYYVFGEIPEIQILITPLIGFVILFGYKLLNAYQLTLFNSVISSLLATIALAISLGVVLESVLVVNDTFYLTALIVNFMSIIIMSIFFNKLSKRTTYGANMLGKILGFRRFLKTAEKQKLEALVMENPSYFFDIMPYTYVLGVSNTWIKKFETISFRQPDWYVSNIRYNDFASFYRHLDSSIASANSYMTSKKINPQNSSDNDFGGFSGGGVSGGGFSGGGVSGGGFGGGGGGVR